MTIHDDLAGLIFAEMTAVMGPLYSDHLARNLEQGDVLDAVHVATDETKPPLVVVVRDPDASNEFHTFGGEVQTIDVDLGYMSLEDEGEFAEWADSQLDQALAVEPIHPEAAALIRQVVRENAEHHEHLVPAGALADCPRSVCRHCSRAIVSVGGRWVDPEASGDDRVWRETCEDHDTFTAEHEPTEEEA